jgi:mRNA-degrading endonuclease HigB of HigAB toxin-antitoxin module
MRPEILLDKNEQAIRKILFIDDFGIIFYVPKYFVPVVCKNKEWLIGYLKGIENCMSQVETESGYIKIRLGLDSFRFIDLIDVEGKSYRLCEHTEFETEQVYKKELSEIKNAKQHPDNKAKKNNDILFSISCPNCGNYYEFKDAEEIPEDAFFCGLCDRLIIDYVYIDDEFIEYNKNPIVTFETETKFINRYFKKLNKELLKKENE